jgi:hypothetical protein
MRSNDEWQIEFSESDDVMPLLTETFLGAAYIHDVHLLHRCEKIAKNNDLFPFFTFSSNGDISEI